LQKQTRISTWDKNFNLVLGNELTGDRPWKGSLAHLYFIDRAVTKTEVASAFSAQDPSAVFGNAVVAWYRLTDSDSYYDEMRHLSDLIWIGEPRKSQTGGGVSIGSHNWLQSSDPAEYLTQKILKTSQFTLGVTVATDDTRQTGPARIVSLSSDLYHRNFTLGQHGDDLYFRIRTPITGKNGIIPGLMVPDVFSTTDQKKIIINYDGSVMHIFVDDVSNAYRFEITPGVIAFELFYGFDASRFRMYKFLYYAIIFIPAGFLLSLMIDVSRNRSYQFMRLIWAILFPCLFLESILVFVSGKDFQLENLFISISLMAVSLTVFKLLVYILSGKRTQYYASKVS
jgi:hypothetical protein